MNCKFSFTGSVSMPKNDSKRPFCKAGTTRDARSSLSMNFGIKASAGNMAFVEAFDAVRESVYTMSADGERLEIPWDSRFDDAVVGSVAAYKKCVVGLGKDNGGRREFLAQYDALEYLAEHLPGFDGQVSVTGEYAKEWYNGRYYDRFRLQNVYAAEDDAKPGLNLTMEVFYHKGCVDKTQLRENKKLIVNGFIEQYIRGEGTRYVPQTLVFSAEKYDLSNERHKQRYDYLMRYIDIQEKTYQSLLWEVALQRGAEEAEFDASMLTDAQREQVALGLKALEDFKPRGQIYGERNNEFRFKLPVLKGKYADGTIETGMFDPDLQAMLYAPNGQDETLPIEKKARPAALNNVEDDDLF